MKLGFLLRSSVLLLFFVSFARANTPFALGGNAQSGGSVQDLKNLVGHNTHNIIKKNTTLHLQQTTTHPLPMKKERNKTNPSYHTIYIQANPKEFSELIDMQKRSKNTTIAITGWMIRKKEQTDSSLIGWIKKTYFLPKITPFTGMLSLRGNFSLSCIKPSFKITTQDEGTNLKLKSLCGSKYGVEEKLFSELIRNISSPLLHPYHVFSHTQEYWNVFVNNNFYGIYGDVPDLDKEYLINNGIILPDKKNTCIVKVGRFLIPDEKKGKKMPITSRLEILDQKYTDQDIDFVMEIKYGDKKFCREQNKKLLRLVNEEKPSRKKIEDIVRPESFLLRGLLLWNTQNHISFTHNYLLIYHDGKFSAGFWDVEDFKGCKMQELSGYWEKDRWEYNKLFSIVLDWYQKNNPDRINFFTKLIEKHICAMDKYTLFKEKHLKYALMDKIMWDMQAETSGKKTKEKDKENTIETGAYQKKIHTLQERYRSFELYFGKQSNSQESVKN